MTPEKSIILILIGINIGVGLMCLTKFRKEFFRMLREASHDHTEVAEHAFLSGFKVRNDLIKKVIDRHRQLNSLNHLDKDSVWQTLIDEIERFSEEEDKFFGDYA